MRFPKSRVLAQVAAVSLKTNKLAIGTELTILDIDQKEITRADGSSVLNDVALCESKSGNVRVPMRELLKMTREDDGKMFATEDGSDDVELPVKFKIVGSADRKNSRTGDTIYPIYAYKGVEDMLESGNIDWNKLVENGLKKDHGFDPVQDYTIAVIG